MLSRLYSLASTEHDEHIHRATSICYRSKQDSVIIECRCGAREIVADWYDKPIDGWSESQWPKLIIAIRCFLESFAE
jgi:hypothetical protein